MADLILMMNANRTPSTYISQATDSVGLLPSVPEVEIAEMQHPRPETVDGQSEPTIQQDEDEDGNYVDEISALQARLEMLRSDARSEESPQDEPNPTLLPEAPLAEAVECLPDCGEHIDVPSSHPQPLSAPLSTPPSRVAGRIARGLGSVLRAAATHIEGKAGKFEGALAGVAIAAGNQAATVKGKVTRKVELVKERVGRSLAVNSVAELNKDVKCPAGHLLRLVTPFDSPRSPLYTCDGCGAEVQAPLRCDLCDFDLCPKCCEHPDVIAELECAKSPTAVGQVEYTVLTNDQVLDSPSRSTATGWSCPNCTFYNTSESVECGACENICHAVVAAVSPPGPVQWRCEHCTLDNESSATHCDACGSPRAVDEIQIDQSDESSHAGVGLTSGVVLTSSSTVEQMDVPDGVSLVAIATDEDTTVQDGGATPSTTTPLLNNPQAEMSTSTSVNDEWTCPACTLQNLATDAVCTICDAPRTLSPVVSISWRCPTCTLDNATSSSQCEACGQAAQADSGEASDSPVVICPTLARNEEVSSPASARSDTADVIEKFMDDAVQSIDHTAQAALRQALTGGYRIKKAIDAVVEETKTKAEEVWERGDAMSRMKRLFDIECDPRRTAVSNPQSAAPQSSPSSSSSSSTVTQLSSSVVVDTTDDGIVFSTENCEKDVDPVVVIGVPNTISAEPASSSSDGTSPSAALCPVIIPPLALPASRHPLFPTHLNTATSLSDSITETTCSVDDQDALSTSPEQEESSPQLHLVIPVWKLKN